MKTYNFKTEPYIYEVDEKLTGEFRDYRNGYTCVNPTGDLMCYLNYIELLNLNRDKWKNVGYLDLGMMPIVMGPSFMHSYLLHILSGVMNELNIPCISMPPVSLMFETCKMPEEDMWAFKEDVAKALKMRKEEVTLTLLLRRCLGI